MNITLTGMMGAGKTTIGKMLASRLEGYVFVDTDEEIIKSENKSINEIFKESGEKTFREIETSILKKVLNRDKQVISTGGGIVINDENIKLLNEKSVMIYLSAKENTLFDRVKNNNERPLLNNTDIKEKISTLLKERENRYKQARFTIDTDGKTPDIIVNEIIGKLQ